MQIIGVIPARYKSSRFPGKPLADICGKPMIWWVYNNAKKSKFLNEVYVATESLIIEKKCQELGINVFLTSDEHQTGTDRIGEVARKIKSDLIVNIQGDEPMLSAETIDAAIEPFFEDSSLEVTNLMAKINNPVDFINFTVPKVVVNKENMGIYLSRSPIPYPKGKIEYDCFKQVCVYGYKPKALEFFCISPRGRLESIEDIEILRFIEAGYKVKFVEVISDTIAVDTPNDLIRVNELMRNN